MRSASRRNLIKTYRQYCPVARASEILAQRWTPIIIRDLLNGPATYTELADGAPGLSRTLLTSRLRELERLELVSRDQDRSSHYALTAAGESLRPVIQALGVWGERWLEIAPEHADPGYVLNSWCNRSLATENLPQDRVVARFDFTDQPKASTPLWVVFNGTATEVCRHFPGFDEDLIVTAESVALTEWHLGRIEWRDALATGRIEVAGAPKLARALPSWNRRSNWIDADHYQAPGVSTSQT